jgi:rhodanese-related sulfurtransferase
MGNNISITKKVNYEDIQYVMKNNNFLLINTLNPNNQKCLIKHTIEIDKEEQIINKCLNEYKTDITIIIYDKNANENNLITKYNQLQKLGFSKVYIYPGGLFEWLCLQDIYGESEFPTTSRELDILKYKAKSTLNEKFLLTDID